MLFKAFASRYEPEPNSGCWLWTGARMMNGYGVMSLGRRKRKMLAHRFAYEHFVGVIPEGLVLDHLCRNPRCVNPRHLEAVPQRTNLLRGTGWAGRHAAQTHCVHGHEFTPENTAIRRGFRECRACRKAQKAAAWRRLSPERREAYRQSRRVGLP